MFRSGQRKNIEVRTRRRSGSALWLLAAFGALAYYLSKPANREAARQKLDEAGLSDVTDRVAQATSDTVKRLQETAVPALESLKNTVVGETEASVGDGDSHLQQAPGSQEKDALQELKESLREARGELQEEK